LVIACSEGKNKSKSIDANGNLVELKNIDKSETWDSQADDGGRVYKKGAADWRINPFPNENYANRKAIDVIVNDDSKDTAIRQILDKEAVNQKYIIGGKNSFNCCDWIVKVLKAGSIDWKNPNPKPFGSIPPRDRQGAKILGDLIDKAYTVKNIGEKLW